MAETTFLVDRRLGAVPMMRVLEARQELLVGGIVPPPLVIAGDRAILTGGQTLTPDVLYPSENNATLRYYVPAYRVAINETQKPKVELRFKAGADDEIGRLTLELTWTVPEASGVERRVMDHVASLTLHYQTPIEGMPPPDPLALVLPPPGWDRTVTLQPLQVTGAFTATLTTIFRDKATFDTVYQAMRSAQQQPSLEVAIRAHVGIRTWRQVIVGRPEMVDQSNALKFHGALFTDLVHAESLTAVRTVPATANVRIRLAEAPPETTFQVARTREAMLQPMISTRATPRVGRTAAAGVRAASPQFAPVRRATPVAAQPVAAQPLASGRGRTIDLERIGRIIDVIDAIRQPRPDPETASQVMTFRAGAFDREALTRVNTPKLAQAIAVSDLMIDGRVMVPIRAVLDTKQEPAIVDADLDHSQTVPFIFDPGLPQHADVFSVEGFDSGGIHLLLPLRLTAPDGSSHVVYQDNLMRDVVHVAPSEFRLERESTHPFLPAITFLASEFGTTDANNDQEAEVLFRVSAVYRLEPWLNPDVVELARAELERQGLVARFTTSLSHDAKLTFDLDLLGENQERRAATIDPATGITDEIALDHTMFVRLWRERLANPTGGIRGRVDYRLFDGSMTQVQVKLSLFEDSADLFDVSFVGPTDQPRQCRVLVRNRIESPARITGLPSELVTGGAVARAVAPEATLGQVLQPLQSLHVDYEISEGPTSVDAFEPTVIGRAEPNLPVLLKKLLMTPGYKSLGFSLTVNAAPDTFGMPAAADPLTGLLVEFDDGSRATLTADQPQAEVSLVGRLVDELMGTTGNTERYFYRVINLHASGEGARTSWTEGQGTAPLQVGTAVVKLDF